MSGGKLGGHAVFEAPRSPRSTAVRQNLRGMRSLLRFKRRNVRWPLYLAEVPKYLGLTA